MEFRTSPYKTHSRYLSPLKQPLAFIVHPPASTVERASGDTRYTQSALSQQDVWYEGVRKGRGEVSGTTIRDWTPFRIRRSHRDRSDEKSTLPGERPKSSRKSLQPSVERCLSYFSRHGLVPGRQAEEASAQFVAGDDKNQK